MLKVAPNHLQGKASTRKRAQEPVWGPIFHLPAAVILGCRLPPGRQRDFEGIGAGGGATCGRLFPRTLGVTDCSLLLLLPIRILEFSFIAVSTMTAVRKLYHSKLFYEQQIQRLIHGAMDGTY